MCLYLQIQIIQTGLRRKSLTHTVHTFDRGESPQVNQDASCPPVVIHRNQTQQPSHWQCQQLRSKYYKFTYWLVRGCYTHWWEDQAGLVATGFPACAGRSTSRWAQGSRWGGGPALGFLCPPWWRKSTFSHKTDLQGETTVTGAVSQYGILGDLFLHRAAARVDIPPKKVACMKMAGCFLSVRKFLPRQCHPDIIQWV